MQNLIKIINEMTVFFAKSFLSFTEQLSTKLRHIKENEGFYYFVKLFQVNDKICCPIVIF